MNTIKIDLANIQQWVKPDEIESMTTEILAAKTALENRSGKGNDFLGWVELPNEINGEMFERIHNDVTRLKDKIKLFVVIGIGGSYLGARAVIEALQSELTGLDGDERVRVIYAGHTLSEDYYNRLMATLDRNDYAVAVISKSGTTTEPAIAFRMIKAHMEQKYGKEEAVQRTIAITDARKGALHDIAMEMGYSMYVIPDNVGGRFSVLTPVGLFPIAMAGYSIEQLIRGAKDMQQLCQSNSTMADNPAMIYAGVRNILYRQGRKVEMLVNFLPELKYISEWWKQLYGESEGKDGKGILPHSLSFTTDLHSMGQYVQDGERHLFETVISVAQPQRHATIPIDERNLDGINYLTGKSLTEINHNAEQGTIMAHVSGGVPVMRIEMPEINEYYLGQLIYFFEYACALSGYTLDVNPFDQPGVEAYKRNMFHLLGKPGYEK